MRTSKLLMFGTALLVLAPTVHAEDGASPAGTGAETEAAMPTAEMPAESGDAVAEAAAPATDAAAETAQLAEDALAEDALAEATAPAVEEMAEPVADAMVEVVDPEAAMPPAAAEPFADAIPGVEPPVADPMSEPGAELGPEEISGVLLGQVGYDAEGRPGRIHVVRRGDTLWFISDAYLGTPWVWPSIWQDNQDIENPHRIYPGDHIWITPSEMRKVTPEEAEALLAGAPVEEELMEPAAQDLADVLIPGPADAIVQAEQPKLRLSDRERVGLVSADEIDAAAGILANTNPRLMISQEDRIYIGLGAGEAAEGDQFTILRVGSKVFDPETERMLGYHVEYLGWIEVMEVDADTSLAVVRESFSEIFKGDKLIARRQPRIEIPLIGAGSGIEGQISFLPYYRTEMGTLDYVYLNRGTQDGVDVGAGLHVYRKGFRTKDEVNGRRREIPDRVVAELVVVRSEPEASVALVRHTEEELARGDYFRGAD
jgi:hypothetical protein